MGLFNPERFALSSLLVIVLSIVVACMSHAMDYSDKKMPKLTLWMEPNSQSSTRSFPAAHLQQGIMQLISEKQKKAIQAFSKEWYLKQADVDDVMHFYQKIAENDQLESGGLKQIEYRYTNQKQFGTILDLHHFISDRNYNWPLKIVCLLDDTTHKIASTDRSCSSAGMKNHTLSLRADFMSLPEKERVRILSHEHIHIIKNHIALKELFFLKAAQKWGDSPPISQSTSAQKLKRSIEFEADTLPFLYESPETLAQGTAQLLQEEHCIDSPDYPSDRLEWATTLAALLKPADS